MDGFTNSIIDINSLADVGLDTNGIMSLFTTEENYGESTSIDSIVDLEIPEEISFVEVPLMSIADFFFESDDLQVLSVDLAEEETITSLFSTVPEELDTLVPESPVSQISSLI